MALLLSTVLTTKPLNSQTINNEVGFYPIQNFSPKDYNGLPQNWSVIQDIRGVVYVGNGDGILEYDGTKWRIISTLANTEVKSLAYNDSTRRIYVGAVNEFGYLESNKFGNYQFKSISDSLIDKYGEFGDIWKTIIFRDIVYFYSKNKIFVLKNDTISTINSRSEFYNFYIVNDIAIVLERDRGLSRIEGLNLISLKGDDFFSDKELYSFFGSDLGKLYGITRESGIYQIDIDLQANEIFAQKITTESDQFITKNQVYHGEKINNRFAIGTYGGAILIDESGTVLSFFNIERGMIDENVKYQYYNSNKLWFGLSNGISMIQINSPLTLFNAKHYVNGTIESITRHNNKLYLATSKGVCWLSESKNSFDLPQFKLVKDLPATESWIVQSFKVNEEHILLVEKNSDIFEIRANMGQSIFEGIPWYIYQRKANSTEFYFGVENGIEIYNYINNNWRKLGILNGINKRITSIYEFGNSLWLAAHEKGIYKLSQKDQTLLNYYKGLEDIVEGPYVFSEFENEFIVGTAEGIFNYSANKDTFIINPRLQKAFGKETRYIHRLSVDYGGKLWAVTYINEKDHELGFFDYDKDSNLFWNPTPFLGNVKGQINAIYHDPDGITWLGGSEGLFRFDSKIEKNYKQDFHCLIRKVRLGEDSTYFFGTYYNENGVASTIQPEALKPVLNYKYNSLIFDYSAMNIDIDQPTHYSYYLEGYDKKWSEWTTETKKEYTNLPENIYAFRVKAKNVYKYESGEGIFEFEILPPWYRTWWAYILFALAALGVVYLIVTQYTKYLRAVIKEKTAEIVEQKDEIEKQNEEITASLKYAERIQKAVVPTNERAQQLLPEHFVLWRPRDIVSGDFWWMTEKNGLVAIVAADCTGHGVPGAFVSMLGVSFLNEIVGKMEHLQADIILNQLRTHVKTTMKQTGKSGESKDGMDIGLIILDLANNRIQYAGAYNPLFLIRDGELLETKATRNPIGIYIKEVDFTNHIIDVQKGDTLYIFSDGFVDQFGGEKGGKFKTKNFKELLLKIQHLPMLEQELLLDRTVDDWRGELEQVDDIIIVGIRI